MEPDRATREKRHRDRWFVIAMCAPLIAGCYEPALRDCTVTCHGVHECAEGQVCGADGFCASPARAGSCASTRAAADAAANASDAAPRPDAAQPPDASGPDAGSVASLSIMIVGRGQVSVSPLGVTCDATGASGATCSYPVTIGDALVLTATPHNKKDVLTGWSGACAGTASSCTLSPRAGTTAVGATFAKAP
jgi:hypothetical protein